MAKSRVVAIMLLAALPFLGASLLAADENIARVLEAGQKPQDARLGKLKDLDGYFPFVVPSTKEAWERRRQELRQQVQVATGLWPMPEKTPLEPVIHGKIERDVYTVEKVFFASYPGHYVCGNLYRPKGKTGRCPGVLCPHGHWADGRFYDAGEKEAEAQKRQGAEETTMGARYPLQARCAQLTRMGCVVFHYDMVGYADSRQISHRAGFTDAQAELRSQSFMGLQTYNSIRALDFLLGLPDVDPERIGVTGASGGGTQTFILCAIDDRPTVAFPAVMVSTAMQGGCICENCSYLRQETGNVELAGLFAPKPLGMSGAHDWTIEIESKGLPELQALYRLYGAEENVMAKCFPQFGHNYNQVSRQLMYHWFNKHLRLEQPEPIREHAFEPVPMRYGSSRHELSVFDNQHPLPKDATGVPELRKYMSESSDRQLAQAHPRDADSMEKFRHVVGTALRVMIHDRLPEAGEVESTEKGVAEDAGHASIHKLLLGRKGKGEQIPALLATPAKEFDTVLVWIHPAGKRSLLARGKLIAPASKLLDRGIAILAPDVFLTGEFGDAKAANLSRYAGFTYIGYNFGYNRPLLANRVHDILTAIGAARALKNVRTVHLAGHERAGPWAILARALSGAAVSSTLADLDGFRFDNIKSLTDEMLLPGAVKYGGLPAFIALCAPGELHLFRESGTDVAAFAEDAYKAANASGAITVSSASLSPEHVASSLVR